jgi:tetratricopeptide (TPR) repeat protein
LGLAELGLAEGELAEALQGYGAVATGSGDWRLRDWAVFRQAQCLELAGRWAEALEVAEVAAQTDLLETRAEADFARRRLKAAVEQPPPPSREPVQYIGEDRSTGGDWYAYYGSEAFILCAQQAPNDLSGDLSGALEVTPRTGRAEEAVRYWVSRPDDTHRASLYNPVSRVRRAANWDDRGEAYDRGAGPDLCLGITVRASGPHRLSLYFVNDHHFYEPRRAYTVQVSDAEGRYLAGTEVRSFLNGVYKQFAVQGPARFTIRIRRNLSMNVLLSGVFLDGVPPEVPGLPDGCQADDRVTLALSEWRAARARARSSADERAASWRLACRLRERRPPAEVGAFLDAVTEAELEARRFGPAMWAADAHSFLLLNDREALREHLLATVTRFSEPSPVRAPHDASAVLPWPYVEATFAQYLDVGGRGLAGEALVGFYRGTAENFLNEQPILAGLAYRQLAGLVGDRGLTPLDHYLMTFASNEPQADAARLERALAETPGLPNRTALQLQLLGRYVALGDIAKAEALAQQLRAQPDDADAAANAAYNLGLLYLTRRQPDEARVRLAAVLNDFPNTHWAQCAQGYLARLPAPLPP